MQQSLPQSRPRNYVVGCDSREDIRVFSGITYHLAEQGVQDGLLSGMVNLYPQGIGAWRVYARAGWWKLSGGLRGRQGFKFTDGFLDSVWKRSLPRLRGVTVINNFQVFGTYFLNCHRAFDIVPYCYIDGTLGEYFGDYRAFDTSDIDECAMRQAFAVERAGYATCRKIAVMSKRTAKYMTRHYGIPQEKIRVLPPGANIPERLLDTLEGQPGRCRRSDNKTLIVGFIGLYPERKGLPIIADAVQLLRRHARYDIRLHVIGRCPLEISQRDGVTDFGIIDKSVDMDRFVQLVRNIDIGCMLSRAETAGIALLEFLRLGIPVIATDVGGIPDILELGAGQLVSPEISAEELAQRLARMIDEPDMLAALQEGAWHRRHNASWRRVVHELKSVLSQ